MSIDQLLLLPPGYGFDSAAEAEPTVFTLVLDDLLTRFVETPGIPATIKFKLTVTDGGGAHTTEDFLTLDTNLGAVAQNTLESVSGLASAIEGSLTGIPGAGYGGLITVSGASSEAGDKYTFTITCDGSLGVTNLAFHASSQWHPTITLTEAVTQQGVADSSAIAEVVTLTAGQDGTGVGVTFSGGLSSFDVSGGVFSSVPLVTGWSLTGGGSGQSTCIYTCDTPGDETDPASGDPTVVAVTVDVQGSGAVVGDAEIHTITPTPVNPTGGTYSLIGSPDMDYDQIGPSPSGGGWSSVSLGANNKLSTGALEFTNSVNGDVADDSLTPVNVSLTAPEITHSIS